MKLEAHQIEDWVSRHFEYKYSKNKTQLRICNPDGDKRFNLYINLIAEENKRGIVSNWVHDFRPKHQDYDGSFIKFVMNYKNLSYYKALADVGGAPSAARRLLQRNRIRDLKKEKDEKPQEHLKLPEHSQEFGDSGKKLERAYRRYLYGRGVSDDVISRNRLYYTPSTIVFPYFEYDDLVYWQERFVMNKRFNFPDESVTGLSKSDFLYGFDNVEYGCESVVVVESIFNCLGIGGDCVATGGAMMSRNSLQVKKLVSFESGLVVLAPDADEAGILSIKKNYFVLRDKVRKLAYSIPPDPDIDWNDMDSECPGSSRSYIENNVYNLNAGSLTRLLNRINLRK